MQVKQICLLLDSMNASTFWNTKWSRVLIRNIIRNCFYTGRVELQRYFVEDHISKRLRPNTGELSRYIIHDHHPAIVSMELFQKAQSVLESRRPKSRKKAIVTPFSGKITCGSCGSHYMRRTINGVKKWQCNTYWEKGKDACTDAKLIPETVLENLSADVLGIPVFNGQVFGHKITHITVPKRNELDFHLADGRIVHRTWEDRSRRDSWTIEMREQAKQRSISKARTNK